MINDVRYYVESEHDKWLTGAYHVRHSRKIRCNCKLAIGNCKEERIPTLKKEAHLIKSKQTNPKKFNSNSKENRYLFLHLPQLSITYPIPVLLLFPFIHQSQGFLFQFSFSCLSDSRDYVFSVAQTLFLLRCKLLFLVAIEKGPFVCSCLLLLMSITVADGNWLVIVNTPNSSPLQHTHSSFSKRRWDKEFSELQSG